MSFSVIANAKPTQTKPETTSDSIAYTVYQSQGKEAAMAEVTGTDDDMFMVRSYLKPSHAAMSATGMHGFITYSLTKPGLYQSIGNDAPGFIVVRHKFGALVFTGIEAWRAVRIANLLTVGVDIDTAFDRTRYPTH